MNQPPSPKTSDSAQRLNAILAEYLKRKDAGQVVSQDAMLKAYPDLADGLRSYFEGEAMMSAGSPTFAATKLTPVPVPSESRETLKPGAVQSDTASEFTSRKFGRYQILRPLGEGAMGSVYLALDTTLDRQVALKVPKTEGTANAEFMARFTREAKAAAALKHPNICSVYDAGEHEGTAYITMDYIEGVPLSRFIGSHKLQSVESILRMITIIAEAVGHAHSKGVIHRDLKPGNILVDSELKPNVTDFGLARRVGGPADESRITQEGLLIGTPAYMAPEQVKGEQAKVGPQCDVYSLGVILFELLTSRLPFEGKVAEILAKVLRDTPPVPSRIRKDLPEDVDDICLKMLKKEPGQRYSSMADVIAAIAKLQKKTTSTAAVPAADAARSQSPFEIQKAHVELMLKKGQYAAAIQDLKKLAAEKSPGAKAVGEWARAKLPIAQAESKALNPSGLAALLQTGQQLFAKSDYPGCIQLLEDVPPLRRTEEMEELLLKARKREADAEQLLSDIKDRERRQEFDGLELLVKRFLKLKPGNTYAKRLWEALQTYGKTPVTRRNYRYEKGRLQPMPEPGFVQRWAALSLLVGFFVFLSVYSYVVIYLKSGNQILAVHVDDDWLRSHGGELTLVVDGNDHTITAPSSGGEPLTVTVTLGLHTFSVKHGDTVVHDPKSFEIEKEGRSVLRITATDVRLENDIPVPRPSSESVALKNVRPAAVQEPESQATDNADLISDLDRAATGTWMPLIDSSTPLPLPEKMKFNNGVLELEASLVLSKLQFRDVIVRADVRKVSGQNVAITVRHSPGKEWTQAYAAWFNGTQSDGGDLFGIAKAMRTSVSLAAGHSGHKFEPDQFVDMAVSVIGDQITLYVEGQKVLSATDADYGAGAIVLGVLRNGRGLFRNVRYQSFDSAVEGPSEHAALSSATEITAPPQTQKVADVQDPNSGLRNISQVHGATAESLVTWTKSLPADYRPYWVSVRGNATPILYDALASRTADQSEWVMQFYDHADETNWDEMKTQYRPALLNVYAKDDIYERLVLWIKDDLQYEYWLGRHSFMEEKLIEGLKWDQGQKSNRQRWLPTSIVGHWLDGGPHYDMLMAWLPYHQCEWELNIPLDEVPALVEKYRSRGWQPANLNIINGSVPARCSAVFGDNPEKRTWTFSPRLSVNEYRSMLIKVDTIGGLPQCVFSRIENSEIIYSVLWHGVEL